VKSTQVSVDPEGIWYSGEDKSVVRLISQGVLTPYRHNKGSLNVRVHPVYQVYFIFILLCTSEVGLLEAVELDCFEK
jgi:hypothetical protein